MDCVQGRGLFRSLGLQFRLLALSGAFERVSSKWGLSVLLGTGATVVISSLRRQVSE